MGAEHIILNVQMEAVPGREEELARELRRLRGADAKRTWLFGLLVTPRPGALGKVHVL
jgi:hypothetical protein